MIRPTIPALVAAALAACAQGVTGSEQTILILSSPDGADCAVTREGRLLGEIRVTPMSLRVPAGTAPLEVTCVLDGYAPATIAVAPETPPGTLGHRTIGGAAGMALDRVLLTDPVYPGSIVVDVAPRRPRPGPAPLAG